MKTKPEAVQPTPTTTEPAAAVKPTGRWGLSEVKFYADREGEVVAIHLRDGATLTGELVGVDNFTLAIASEGKTVLVLKHAIDWIV